MSFEQYIATGIGSRPALAEGEACISRGGNLTFRRADALLIGLADEATVLIDKGSLRIGIRKPRGGEIGTLRVCDAGGKGPKARVKIGLSGSLRALGLEASAVVGRHTFITHHDLLILALASGEAASSKRPAAVGSGPHAAKSRFPAHELPAAGAAVAEEA